jgi:APA family basic amino acid/polyamine antiporter
MSQSTVKNTTEPSSSQPQLLRVLNAKTGTALIIGGIIGSGIFMVPSSVASQVGSPSLSLLVWIGAAVLSLAGALCFAELGAAIPESGGTYAFLKRAYGSDVVAYLFGWAFLFIIITGAMGAVASTFARYAGGLFEINNLWTERFIAVGCILFLTFMNCLGVKVGGRILYVFAFIKVGAVVGVIVLGVAFGQGGEVAWTPLVQDQSGTDLLGGFSLAMLGALFAFNGWFFVCFISSEMKDPERNIPRSIFAGLGIVALVYLLANVVYLTVLSFDQLQQSQRVAADTMQVLVGANGAMIISAVIMLTSFGTVNAQLMAAPRVYHAMANHGIFFKVVQYVHPKFRTPMVSIVFQGLWASVFALSGTYVQIIGFTTFFNYIFLTLAVIGLILIRKKEPDLPRPYRTWGYPVTPILFLLISTGVLVNVFITDYTRPVIGALLLCTGLPFYFYWKNRRGDATPPS